MHKLIALLAWAACSLASAQVQISTGGNFGGANFMAGAADTGQPTLNCVNTPTLPGCNLTQGRFQVVDQFSAVVQANFPDLSPNYTFDSELWTVSGQNGMGACAGRGCSPPTYHTMFPDGSVYLMTAQPSVDADGNPVMVQGYCGAQPCTLQQWDDVEPALDVNGNPAVFVHSTYTCGVWGTCDRWTLMAQIPPGNYNLHVSGMSCGLRSCTGPGMSTVSVGSHPTYTYVPPPAPICTDECMDAVRAAHGR
jgi:uncharacterized Zn-binding protein involved in type VI secretion